MSEPDSSGPPALRLKYPYSALFLVALLILLFALLFDLTPLEGYLPAPALVRSAAGIGAIALLTLALHLHTSLKITKAARAAAEIPAPLTTPQSQAVTPPEKRLLSELVHELRSPLTAIQGFTALLTMQAVPETTRQEWLQTLQQEAQRMSALLEQTLDIVRLREGRLQLHLQTVKPQEWLTEVLARCRSLDLSTPPHLDINPDAPPICVDTGRLERALQTFLEVTTAAAPAGASLLLRYLPVCPAPHPGHRASGDSCPGGPTILITAAGLQIEAVATGLASTPQPHTPPPEGVPSTVAGLRLTLAREIVTLHGGTVWVQRHDREGTIGAGYLGITLPPGQRWERDKADKEAALS